MYTAIIFTFREIRFYDFANEIRVFLNGVIGVVEIGCAVFGRLAGSHVCSLIKAEPWLDVPFWIGSGEHRVFVSGEDRRVDFEPRGVGGSVLSRVAAWPMPAQHH